MVSFDILMCPAHHRMVQPLAGMERAYHLVWDIAALRLRGRFACFQFVLAIDRAGAEFWFDTSFVQVAWSYVMSSSFVEIFNFSPFPFWLFNVHLPSCYRYRVVRNLRSNVSFPTCLLPPLLVRTTRRCSFYFSLLRLDRILFSLGFSFNCIFFAFWHSFLYVSQQRS